MLAPTCMKPNVGDLEIGRKEWDGRHVRVWLQVVVQQGAGFVMPGGEGPALNSGQGLAIALAIDGLPGAVFPEEVKAARVDESGESGKGSGIVVAGCCTGLDAGGVELLESRLEWGDGFEEAVVLVDDIAAEEHQVHLLFDRAFNEPCPHRCAGESFGIPEVIGDLAGASADVKVAGGEDLYGHQFQGSVRGDVNLVSRRRAGAGGAILA